MRSRRVRGVMRRVDRLPLRNFLDQRFCLERLGLCQQYRLYAGEGAARVVRVFTQRALQLKRRVRSSSQPKERKRGVRLDQFRQDGSGNAREYRERIFVFAHPRQRDWFASAQQESLAGIYAVRSELVKQREWLVHFRDGQFGTKANVGCKDL
jgi:hypothetical protein